MNHEKSLIDSFLAFNVSNQKSADGNQDSRNDGDIRDETPSYRRLSDPPSTNDSLLFGNVPTTGVGGTRPSSTSLGGGEQQLGQRDIYNPNEFNRSPPRYKVNSEHPPNEFSSDSYALGAISRYTNEEESTSARFPNVAPIETNNSYIIREPEDNIIIGRKNLSSKDLNDPQDDATHFGRDYSSYDNVRSRSGSGVTTTTSTPRHFNAQQQEVPLLSQQQPQSSYSASASSPTFHNGPAQQQQQEFPVRTQNRYPAQAPAQPYQQQQQQQQPRYAGQQQQPAPYAGGGRSPMRGDPYGGYPAPAPAHIDPYAYKGQAPPYRQPYNQNYRQPPPPYGAPVDPYGGYGAPPPPQYAPRYGKPAPNMGYRAPYGREDPHDPYYRGAPPAPYGVPPPGVPYGYAPYPEDPYANSGAAAVNRALGRTNPAPGQGDGYGPPSYRNSANARLRDRALAQSEPVNLDNVDPNTTVYQVQFKKTIRNFTLRPGDATPLQAGDFVIVQADRGEDLGVITDSYPVQTFIDRRYAMRAYMDEEDQNVGYILRLASPSETKLLPEKFQDEEMIFKTCENLAIHTYRLPMTVVDVEYQFDRHKITIYYDSPLRIDFRELVRDLFSSFKARIWMKKINQFQAPDIQQFAAIALATGVKLAAGSD